MIPYHEAIKEARSKYHYETTSTIPNEPSLWIEKVTTHSNVQCWVIVFDERGLKIDDDLFIIKFASTKTKLIRHLLSLASDQMVQEIALSEKYYMYSHCEYDYWC